MPKKYYIYHDPKRCIGCLACEVSCTDWKGLPYGLANCRIFRCGPDDRAWEKPEMEFLYVACFHCEDPWCVEACPTGALYKRESDGTVVLKQDLCVGCGACFKACPWGIPRWNPETGTMVKCDFCVERRDEGLEPACVSRCPTGALRFVSAEEISMTKREKWLKKVLKRDVLPLEAR